VPAEDGPRWSDAIEAEEDADAEDTGDWSDIDIDAPDGTRG
jgi:hypothetical protein